MDIIVVYNSIELAYVWGSSPEEFESDVFEHSTCGIFISTDDFTVSGCADLGFRTTVVRTLRFPFNLTEFEVLLRTIERDYEMAMIRRTQEGLPKITQPNRKRRQPSRRRAVTQRPRYTGKVESTAAEEDISSLWVVPDHVKIRSHVNLATYKRELNEPIDSQKVLPVTPETS